MAAVELDVAVAGDAGAVFGVDAGVLAVAGVPLGGVAAVGVEGTQVQGAGGFEGGVAVRAGVAEGDAL
ncbi:hypothetical protein ADT30_11645 [Xylella fastidiosa]|nr:hypothetical protein ADT30_11645 [Xylella fastidiosa]